MNVIITGDKDVGKTTVVKKIVNKLKTNGYKCSGFYTTSGPENCLSIVSVRTHEKYLLGCEEDRFSNSVKVKKYYFNPETISRGRELMEESGDILIVDELGWLEGRKEGFFPVFEKIKMNRYLGSFLSVRKELKDFFIDQLNEDEKTEIFEVKIDNRSFLPNNIMEVFENYLKSDKESL